MLTIKTIGNLIQKISNEFNGSSLDTNRWYDYLTYFKDRAPSISSKKNVAVENGNIVLSVKYETIPEMAEVNKTATGTTKYEKYTTACVISKKQYSYKFSQVWA